MCAPQAWTPPAPGVTAGAFRPSWRLRHLGRSWLQRDWVCVDGARWLSEADTGVQTLGVSSVRVGGLGGLGRAWLWPAHVFRNGASRGGRVAVT